jgi:hypothetical protein
MLNHNRAPKLVIFGTAIALGLSACTSTSESTSSDSTTTTAPTKPRYVGDDIPPKDLATCKGKLDGFKPGEPSWGKNGNIYEVTRVSNGPCASVYDLSTLKDFGGLAVGDEFIGGCTFDDKPARIHVLAPITTGNTVGDVNLTEAGLEQVRAAKMPSCESQGISDKGFFTPK